MANKVKIFRSHINELHDTAKLEDEMGALIKDKKIISITQSLTSTAPRTQFDKSAPLYFTMITVVYED